MWEKDFPHAPCHPLLCRIGQFFFLHKLPGNSLAAAKRFHAVYSHPMETNTPADWLAEGRRVLREAAGALTSLADHLQEDSWRQAVSLLLNAQGRIVVSGMGKSGLVGRKLAATLSSTGTPALFLHPGEAVHGDLGVVQPGDIVIALSYSGETDELLAILPSFTRLNIPILALTGQPASTLGQASATVLSVHVDREACPIKLAPTTSTTAMIALGDALAVSVMVARQFTPENYALFHPAGTLGRRLTLRVGDLMRTGEAVAIVPETASVLDTMFAITRAHAGAAIVTDDIGQVSGLLTDGDIRRYLLRDQSGLSHPVSLVMNAHPGILTSDLLAVDGLRRLGEFHPQADSRAGEAPVVDAGGRPVGMLMLKDLVKAGIV